MSELRVLNAGSPGSGTPTNLMAGLTKSWIDYKGTATVGINASFNISSVTNNTTGDYTLNFNNVMSSTFYASSGHGNLTTDNGSTSVGQQVKSHSSNTRLAGSLRVLCGRHGTGWSSSNFDVVTVMISGDLA